MAEQQSRSRSDTHCAVLRFLPSQNYEIDDARLAKFIHDYTIPKLEWCVREGEEITLTKHIGIINSMLTPDKSGRAVAVAVLRM
eukprot:scaffold40464_cov155-Skeletonema_dohrnii-CCMP3373.AAC.1